MICIHFGFFYARNWNLSPVLLDKDWISFAVIGI
ncbi:hypothetical protein SAMN05444397_101163 [Flavobacterium aquidurense]|nr:hypothetical protein SAMN05444397_101163 [Flavobacterium aquidurense]